MSSVIIVELFCVLILHANIRKKFFNSFSVRSALLLSIASFYSSSHTFLLAFNNSSWIYLWKHKKSNFSCKDWKSFFNLPLSSTLLWIFCRIYDGSYLCRVMFEATKWRINLTSSPLRWSIKDYGLLTLIILVIRGLCFFCKTVSFGTFQILNTIGVFAGWSKVARILPPLRYILSVFFWICPHWTNLFGLPQICG